MKKRNYYDPGATASLVNIFDNAVNVPVREDDDFEDDGAYMDDDVEPREL